MKLTLSNAATIDVDEFTQAYLECALWSSTLEPFGACPDCGKTCALYKWNDDQEPVCDECGTQDAHYEPPADDNYTIDDFTDEAILTMIGDCQAFQEECGAWIIAENYKGNNPFAQAGYDFWLTRNHHGAGFWDGDWREPFAKQLTDAAHACGECDLYVDDQGKIGVR